MQHPKGYFGEINFAQLKNKPLKCANCGKEKGYHKGITLHCPVGLKTRVGYLHYHATDTFVPKNPKFKKSK